MTVLHILQSGVAGNRNLTNLCYRCCDMIKQGWEIRLQHTYREGNRVADKLANLALSFPLGFQELSHIPGEFRELLHDDRLGMVFPRLVSV